MCGIKRGKGAARPMIITSEIPVRYFMLWYLSKVNYRNQTKTMTTKAAQKVKPRKSLCDNLEGLV